jgi:Tfp pilus assembly protein FimT
MNLPKTKPNYKTSRKGGGFSAIELIITVSVITIVTGFGVLGITRAKASMRLAGAAREYASYIEKARVSSIRSHAERSRCLAVSNSTATPRQSLLIGAVAPGTLKTESRDPTSKSRSD